MSTELLKSLEISLDKACSATTLIEFDETDLTEAIRSGFSNDIAGLYKKVYDKRLSDSTLTNVLMIDANNDNRSQILKAVFESIHTDLRQRLGLDAVIRLFSFMGVNELSSAFSEHVNSLLGDSLNSLFEHNAGDWAANYSVNKVQEKLGDSVEDKAVDTATHIRDKKQFSNHLFLTSAATTKLIELHKSVPKSATPVKVMAFALSLIETIAIDAPKLIVVNNPTQLDAVSFALIATLFSKAKDKENNSKSNVSIVFNYQKAPYYSSNNSANQALLLSLRRFVQRYDLLEKPGKKSPEVAIAPNVFVGRENELTTMQQGRDNFLKQCNQFKKEQSNKNIPSSEVDNFDNRKLNNWFVVHGEPGTGKTALVNQFLKSAVDEHQIRLKVINQTGHSSELTGLASLKSSLESEHHRLRKLHDAKYSKSMLGKVMNFAQTQKLNVLDSLNIINKERKIGLADKLLDECVSLIGTLTNTSGVIDGLKSSYKTMDLTNTNDLRLDTLLESESCQSLTQKTSYFTQVLAVIDKLSMISKEIEAKSQLLPIQLFIDDIQWLDEMSAEFLVDHLLRNYCVDVIITSRISDGISSFKRAFKNPTLSPYKLALFQYIELNIDADSNEALPGEVQAISSNNFSSNSSKKTIKLYGMDQPTLAQLISRSYADLNSVHASLIAGYIIRGLSVKNESLPEELFDDGLEARFVITLFAIETLNLISDPRFYRNTKIKPLFACNDNGLLCVVPMDTNEISTSLKGIFKHLTNDVHKKAFEHESLHKSTNEYFTLASYAVMEERIAIIQEYFEEYGNAAVFSLQLGAMIGTPFDSHLVSQMITVLTALDIKYDSHLHGLRRFLLEQEGIALTVNDFQVLEHSYYMVRRLKNLSSMHQYYHHLINVFLKMQMNYFVETNISTLRGKNEFFELVFQLIIKWSDTENIPAEVSKTHFDNVVNNNFFHFFQFTYNSTKQEHWLERYCIVGCREARSKIDNGQFESAFELCEQLLSLIPVNASISLIKTRCIFNSLLGQIYREKGCFEQALEFDKIAVSTTQLLIDNDTLEEEALVIHLSNLAFNLKELDQIDKAMEIEKKVLSIVNKNDISDVQSGELDNFNKVTSLNNYAFSCEKNQDTHNALKFYQEALTLSTEYKDESNDWLELYAKQLHNLGLFLLNYSEDKSEAATLIAKAASTGESLYEDDKRYLAVYVTALNSMGKVFNYSAESIEYYEKCCELMAPQMEVHPSHWVDKYIASKSNLASAVSQVDINKAIGIWEECIKTHESETTRTGQTWELILLGFYLNIFRVLMNNNGSLSIKEHYSDLSIALLKKLYDKSPEQHAKQLADLYFERSYDIFMSEKDSNKALKVCLLATKIEKKHQSEEPEYWIAKSNDLKQFIGILLQNDS